METTTNEAPATTGKTAPRKTGKTRGEKVALKSICSQLRIEPKKARRILRKADLSFHTLKDRWMLTEAQAEKVRNILRPPKTAKKAAEAPADAPKPN